MSRGGYIKSVWQGKKCVLCGGLRPAESAEHAPPKVIFRNKHRPIGLEVPACKRCNAGSSDQDQIAAFLALSQSPDSVLNATGMSDYDHKVTKGTANNAPQLYVDFRHVLVSDGDGAQVTAYQVELTHQTGMMVAKWCVKQALAIWYAKTGKIVSHRATITVELLTNAKRPDPEMEQIIHSMGPIQSLGGAKFQTDDQFFYKIEVHTDGKQGIVFAQYHGGFAFIAVINDRATAKLSRRGLGHTFGTNANRGIHFLW